MLGAAPLIKEEKGEGIMGAVSGGRVGRRGSAAKGSQHRWVPLGAGGARWGSGRALLRTRRAHAAVRGSKNCAAHGAGAACVVQGVSRAALATRSLSSRATPR